MSAYPNGAIEVFPVKDLEDYLYQDDSDVKIEDVTASEPKQAKEENKEQSAEDLMKARDDAFRIYLNNYSSKYKGINSPYNKWTKIKQ